mmetsp:Transcript_38114/g.89316  ORF Transcript_38114/g.89316 Transcript_38114/m.89316 type:complete len:746 (+) Transcript_38114:46-2283(+)
MGTFPCGHAVSSRSAETSESAPAASGEQTRACSATEASGTATSDPALWMQIASPCQGSVVGLAEPIEGNEHTAPDCTGIRMALQVEKNPSVQWAGFCAVCKRPLTLSLTHCAKRKRTEADSEAGGPCAYVIALWGSSAEYVLGAMVLGWSLQRTGTRHDLVVVHTDDVSSAALDLLRKAGWKPRQVEHIAASGRLSSEGCTLMRFAQVFTKLRVMELVEYSKILLMDIDLLVLHNIDDLFELEAPAAMVRGPQVNYSHGERVNGAYFFAGSRDDRYSWGQSSGINAGIMLLEPSAETFSQMLSEVTDDRHPEHVPGSGPEQDYLSRFYASSWRHISVGYNFQLHHMYFALSPACPKADRLPLMEEPDKIKVLHYSSEPKPWSRLLEEKYKEFSKEAWLEEILLSFTGYRAWVLKDLDLMKHEGERSGLVMGPDECLHRIDWSRVNTQEELPQEIEKFKQREEDPLLQAYYGRVDDEAPDRAQQDVPAMGQDAAAAHDESHTTSGQLMSEDGWPLCEALTVSENAIAAAKGVVEMSQDVWFEAYKELCSSLDEGDLAGAALVASTGPIIRQEWDWTSSEWPRRSKAQYAASWASADGWWQEQPIERRCIALATTLPATQVTLTYCGDVLLSSSDPDTVHVAVTDTGPECTSAASLSTPDQASDWASTVPRESVVLLAVAVNSNRDQVNSILAALASCGVGCPRAMAAGCRAAAAVGQMGVGTWYNTHAAQDIAMASMGADEANRSS